MTELSSTAAPTGPTQRSWSAGRQGPWHLQHKNPATHAIVSPRWNREARALLETPRLIASCGGFPPGNGPRYLAAVGESAVISLASPLHPC